MPSTRKCEYCGSVISSNDKTCLNCGASNDLYVNDTEHIVTDPCTIKDLQEYCAERGMPLARMRFFIGENFKEPKAFGIYKDNRGKFIVYKNKANGERAIRYEGSDEAYAVAELYAKLLEECHNRGIYPDGKPTGEFFDKQWERAETKRKQQDRAFKTKLIVSVSLWVIIILALFIKNTKHPKGYYRYNDRDYYYTGSTWYGYYGNDWFEYSDSEIDTIYDSDSDYYVDEWSGDWGESFINSDAYREYESSHSSDSSYDSWDSSSTDWDSDW